MFWVSVLLITEFALFAKAYLSFKGDIVSPSVVTLGFFIIATSCCLYGISDWRNIVFTSKGYMLFTVSFILMITVEKFVMRHKFVIFGKTNRVEEVSDFNRLLYIPEPVSTVLFALFSLAALYYVYRVYRSGILLGASGFFSAIGFNKEEGDYDTVSRLLYNFVRIPSYVYVVMVCHNVICCKDKVKNNLKEIILIAITVFCTFFSGQRSAMICYIVGIVVAASISLKDSGKIAHEIDTKKFIRKLMIIALIIIIGFFLSTNIVKATSIQRNFVDYMTYYFGSPLGIMGNIVMDPSICHYPFVGYFGEKTFMGFWQTMYSWGIVALPPAERKWVNIGSMISNRAGNEYTFLCGPYIDFGFVGTLIFVVLFYLFFSSIYYGKIIKNKMSMKRVRVTAVYIFLYTMVAMAFYQDTIRTYSRPINLLYIVYMIVFAKIFLRFKRSKL